MKKFAILLTTLTMMGGNVAHAANGQAANAGSDAGSNGMAWGIGLGTLAAVATVVGVTVASASKDASSFSH